LRHNTKYFDMLVNTYSVPDAGASSLAPTWAIDFSVYLID